jgi:predicted nucleotide-binding protein
MAKPKKTEKQTSVPPSSLRGRIKSDFPKHSFEQALRVAKAIEEANGGKPLPPLEAAQALGISPGSSDFRVLLSSSIKYGLTSGSFNSDRINLEPLGQSIVEPRSEEEAKAAMQKAAFNPETLRAIFDYYKGKKLPEQTFFENAVSREFGVPKEHASTCVQVFTANVEFLGLAKFLKSGKWLGTEPQFETGKTNEEQSIPKQESNESDAQTEAEEDVAKRIAGVTDVLEEKIADTIKTNHKVFISHGKNKEIVSQLKELLTFGRFDPVVSVERDTTSIPVPEKVFQDMRDCAAAVIHVMSEGNLLDTDGKQVPRINENVLIEIGAAIALYDKKFVLLVQKGVKLPSNLQGLYRCEYEGDKLDYEATMKLLKTFNQFRDNPKP